MLEMKVVNDMVYFDKSTFHKLEAQVADVQNSYKGTMRRSTVQNALQKLDGRAKDADGGLRSIFQSALQNLEDHVTVVENSNRHRLKGVNFQKLYRSNSVVPASKHNDMSLLPYTSDVDTQSYYDSLCSSLQVFQIRKWRPMTANWKPQSSVVRVRPMTERPRSSPGLGTSLSLQQRKMLDAQERICPHVCSRSAKLYPRPLDTSKVEKRKLDIWSPNMLSLLNSEPHASLVPLPCNQPLAPSSSLFAQPSVTHSPVDTPSYPQPPGLVSAFADNTQKIAPKIFAYEKSGKYKVQDGDFSSTSGIESDDGSNEAVEEDNNSTSDSEKVNKILFSRQIRIPSLHLRPETVNTACMSESNLDFDFNADIPEAPAYEFKCPLPSPFDTIDIHTLAKEKINWRNGNEILGPFDPTVSGIMDRLVEIERHQSETQEWEERQMRLARKRSVSCSNRARDKTSNSFVNQSPNTNTGDNVDTVAARDSCHKCQQPLCEDISKDNKFEESLCQSREDAKSTSELTAVLPEQYCRSCQKGHNVKVKYANQLILRRPKSAFSTPTRNRSCRRSRAVRPITVVSIPLYSCKDADKNGLELSHCNNKQLISVDKGCSLNQCKPQSSHKARQRTPAKMTKPTQIQVQNEYDAKT